jgi:hypothetical protein
VVHPPVRARKFVRTFEDSVLALTETDEAVSSSYGLELTHSDLVGRIERSLRESLPPNFNRVHAPSGDWLRIVSGLYLLVRILKPVRVVETGVGIVGGTSAYILEGLERNSSGHLWSIDPDRFQPVYGFHVGAGIPPELRRRQTVLHGESRDELPRLLASLPDLDLFVHDGCHTYRNMLWEFEQASTVFREGAFLASDDVVNSSIDEFAARRGLEVAFTRYDRSQFAIVRLPASQQARPTSLGLRSATAVAHP